MIIGAISSNNAPGVTATLNRLIFEAPFNPFVHRWTEFTAALARENDETTKRHLELLYKTLEEELKDIITARADYIKNQVITFQHLWTIFVPGSTLYTAEWGHDCGSKYVSGNYLQHAKFGSCFGVNTEKVDWDGEKFGYAKAQYLIPAYHGTTSIASLEVLPLDFHPEKESITAGLLQRGKIFEEYHGYHYKTYQGFAVGRNRCGQDIKVTVDSRIIV